MNILLTSVGCMGYVGLIKAFQEQGHKVFGTDCDENAVGFKFCDDFYLLPHGDDEDYVETVLRACVHYDIDLIVPSSDNEILKIGQNREVFTSVGYKTFLPSSDSLRICDNKRLFYEGLDNWNIPHPAVHSLLEAEFPAIVKPEVGKGSSGVRKVLSLDDTPFLSDDYIIQDFIVGDEYTVDILADESSNIVSAVKRKRAAIESGISIQAEVVEISEEEQLIFSELNARLNMVGIYCLQYIKNDTGIYILEINPRFGGGSILSIQADPSIIPNYLNLAMGEPATLVSNPKHIKMKRYYAEVYE